jgi:hypothetical protein
LVVVIFVCDQTKLAALRFMSNPDEPSSLQPLT